MKKPKGLQSQMGSLLSKASSCIRAHAFKAFSTRVPLPIARAPPALALLVTGIRGKGPHLDDLQDEEGRRLGISLLFCISYSGMNPLDNCSSFLSMSTLLVWPWCSPA